MAWSSHIAYFDESGDHGLTNIDPTYPVFVLCGCVFKIEDYAGEELRRFSSIKFKHFGHDAVIFHSWEIRKRLGPFHVLQNQQLRTEFMQDVADYFQHSSATLIAAAIHKTAHLNHYAHPANPYEISLLFCLERLYAFLRDRGDHTNTTVCVFEARGKMEDNALAARFSSICAGANMWGQLPFQMVFANKLANMPGLQISDLAAYPIARHIMNPAAPNPAYAALSHRIRRSPNGQILGWGLKVFP